MSIAEKLYTKGLISYPRTETTTYYPLISPKQILNKLSYNLRKEIESEGETRISSKFTRTLTSTESYLLALLQQESPFYQAPRPGKLNDNAHPPIHPVKMPSRSDYLNDQELRVFNFILEHFLAQCSKDKLVNEVRVSFSPELEFDLENGEKVEFEAKMIEVLNSETNFEIIYQTRINLSASNDQIWTQETQNQFCLGNAFNFKSKVTNVKTQPPQPLSEADLVSLLYENGIGTDATIHEHIKKIQDREYAQMKNPRGLESTKLGKALVHWYRELGQEAQSLIGANIRGELESELQQVAEGQLNRQSVLDKWLNIYGRAFDIAEQGQNNLVSLIQEEFGDFGVGTDSTSNPREFQLFSGDKCEENCQVNARIVDSKIMFECSACLKKFPTPIWQNNFYKVLDEKCKLDGNRVVEFETKFKTKQFLSPWSYNYLLSPVSNQWKPRGKKLPCYQCEVADCQFSNKMKYELKQCPTCNSGSIVIRRRRDGVNFLTCNRYPKCSTTGSIPEDVEQIVPTSQPCAKCFHESTSYLVELKFKGNTSGSDLVEKRQSNTFCLHCDEDLQEAGYSFEVKENPVLNQNSYKRRRKIICYKCKQPGHYANQCPN